MPSNSLLIHSPSAALLLLFAAFCISRASSAETSRPQLAFSGVRFPCPAQMGSRNLRHFSAGQRNEVFLTSRACLRRRAMLCQLDPGAEKFKELEKRLSTFL